MNRPVALLPLGQRRVAAEALIGAGATLAALARIHGFAGLELAGLAFLVAASLLLVIQAPNGSVPLGYALIIALAEIRDVGTYFTVLGLGLLVTIPVLTARYGQGDTLRRIIRWLPAGCACGGAAAVARLLAPNASPPDPTTTLLHVSIAGIAFLVVDLLLRRSIPTSTAPPMRLRDSWPLHLSLLCAAGLLAVGFEQGGTWMALVALLPLVMTRFAYDRYAAAQEAYQQTIKALSIVPEVAGVTPLGHGERSAVYAVAMARQLGLSVEGVERVATAARLHHIGYVSVDDPQTALHSSDRRVLARLGGEILRETHFLSEVGDLVEAIHIDGPGPMTREAAVLRVATEFDHLVLHDPARANGAVELLAFDQKGPFGAAAVLALRRVLEDDPEVLQRAIASGAPLTEAASASRAAYG